MGKVLFDSNNLYARWRLQSGAVPLLREEHDTPPERLLQAVWQHQRLVRESLTTVTGETLRVLHPGFLNREGGPDFRGAVVQFGDSAPCTGDIEVDLEARSWRAHGHDRNPAFKTVILQVIWDEDQPMAGAPPAVPIRRRLDMPVTELGLWLDSEAAGSFPDQLRGRCHAALRGLAPADLRELLRQAAQIRFRGKAARLHARARQAGWEQALWEGLFRGLGYKHNAWPMHCLAEQRKRWMSPRLSPLALQARLLGIGSLLPAELTRARGSADGYLREVWDYWWRERDEFADCVLPRKLWRFHGQRPANHPQRRLALASHWLAAGELAARLEKWCAIGLREPHPIASLLEVLQVPRDGFWSWHWTIRSGRLKRPQPLVGAGRATDLAANVILPWLWIRAAEGKNQSLQSTIEDRFYSWPAAEDNALLRLARERLLGGAPPRILAGAAEQQGLIQIVRDFCDHSNSACQDCRFPELVWTAGRAGVT